MWHEGSKITREALIWAASIFSMVFWFWGSLKGKISSIFCPKLGYLVIVYFFPMEGPILGLMFWFLLCHPKGSCFGKFIICLYYICIMFYTMAMLLPLKNLVFFDFVSIQGKVLCIKFWTDFLCRLLDLMFFWRKKTHWKQVFYDEDSHIWELTQEARAKCERSIKLLWK